MDATRQGHVVVELTAPVMANAAGCHSVTTVSSGNTTPNSHTNNVVSKGEVGSEGYDVPTSSHDTHNFTAKCGRDEIKRARNVDNSGGSRGDVTCNIEDDTSLITFGLSSPESSSECSIDASFSDDLSTTESVFSTSNLRSVSDYLHSPDELLRQRHLLAPLTWDCPQYNDSLNSSNCFESRPMHASCQVAPKYIRINVQIVDASTFAPGVEVDRSPIYGLAISSDAPATNNSDICEELGDIDTRNDSIRGSPNIAAHNGSSRNLTPPGSKSGDSDCDSIAGEPNPTSWQFPETPISDIFKKPTEPLQSVPLNRQPKVHSKALSSMLDRQVVPTTSRATNPRKQPSVSQIATSLPVAKGSPQRDTLMPTSGSLVHGSGSLPYHQSEDSDASDVFFDARTHASSITGDQACGCGECGGLAVCRVEFDAANLAGYIEGGHESPLLVNDTDDSGSSEGERRESALGTIPKQVSLQEKQCSNSHSQLWTFPLTISHECTIDELARLIEVEFTLRWERLCEGLVDNAAMAMP
ncbi:hypothetical protein EV182_000932, partial [Spiromyces aspiralis]